MRPRIPMVVGLTPPVFRAGSLQGSLRATRRDRKRPLFRRAIHHNRLVTYSLIDHFLQKRNKSKQNKSKQNRSKQNKTKQTSPDTPKWNAHRQEKYIASSTVFIKAASDKSTLQHGVASRTVTGLSRNLQNDALQSPFHHSSSGISHSVA